MMEMTSQSHTDEAALFDDDDDEDEELMAARKAMLSGDDAQGSTQRLKSFNKQELKFNGVEKSNESGHCIQNIKQLITVPVIVTSDMSKSPPVLKVSFLKVFESECPILNFSDPFFLLPFYFRSSLSTPSLRVKRARKGREGSRARSGKPEERKIKSKKTVKRKGK